MTTGLPDRTLPHNLDAERAVLGAVLVTSGQAMDAIVDYLRAEDFIRSAHQVLFRTCLEMHARNAVIDLVTLSDELARAGRMADVGGVGEVAKLTDGVPRSVNLPAYARIVKAHAQRRTVIYAANKLLTKAYEHDGEIPELLDEAERALLDVSARTAPGDLVGADELVRRVLADIERLHEQRRPIAGLATGFTELDRLTRGLHPGNLIIVAGRPSMGKSTLATQIAVHASRTAPVALFSLEMSQTETTFRVLSSLAGVDGHAIQCGQMSMFDYQNLAAAAEDLRARQFFVDDTRILTALQVRSKARRLKARVGLGLVVVDYLGLLQHPKAETESLRVGASCRLLLHTAWELNVPVIAVCQLNRGSDQRSDARPRLSDLRDSGSLEQDAHVVLAIHRQAKKDAGPEPWPELYILKQRNGPTTRIDLKWIPEQYRFADLEGE